MDSVRSRYFVGLFQQNYPLHRLGEESCLLRPNANCDSFFSSGTFLLDPSTYTLEAPVQECPLCPPQECQHRAVVRIVNASY